MPKIISILLSFFIVNIALAQVPLTDSEIQNLKEKVIATANNTHTISSDFVQKKHLSFLTNDIETIGKLHFKAPDWIRWEYTDPYAYSVVFKNEKLHINDEGNKNEIDLAANKMFQSMNKLMANSIKGDLFDTTAFEIAYFRDNKNYLVQFVPKDENLKPYIHAFELTFNQKDGNVLSVKMIEPSEDYTHIIFKNRQINTAVADAIFDN